MRAPNRQRRSAPLAHAVRPGRSTGIIQCAWSTFTERLNRISTSKRLWSASPHVPQLGWCRKLYSSSTSPPSPPPYLRLHLLRRLLRLQCLRLICSAQGLLWASAASTGFSTGSSTGSWALAGFSGGSWASVSAPPSVLGLCLLGLSRFSAGSEGATEAGFHQISILHSARCRSPSSSDDRQALNALHLTKSLSAGVRALVRVHLVGVEAEFPPEAVFILYKNLNASIPRTSIPGIPFFIYIKI